MRKVLTKPFLTIATVGIFLLTACGSIKSDSSVGTGSSAQGQFSVNVSTIYESLTEATTWKTCDVTSASGTASDCTATIPEGQLYFSNLKFTVTTPIGHQCSRISFHPYWAVRSVNAAFDEPETSTAVDCSGGFSSRPALCYEGAARDLVPNFPVNGGVYYVPGAGSSTQEYTFTKSANQRRIDLAGVDFGNLWTSNNLLEADRGAAIDSGVKQYAGGDRYNDYTFSCRDVWDEPLYSLTVYVLEQNGATGTILDWQ